MKWIRRVLEKSGIILPDADDLWLRHNHVPLENVTVGFFCAKQGCEHWYAPAYAIHIGFRCHMCCRPVEIRELP